MEIAEQFNWSWWSSRIYGKGKPQSVSSGPNTQDSKQAAGTRSNSLEETEGLEETWAGGPLER